MRSGYFSIELEMVVRCSACGDFLESEWDARNGEIKAGPCKGCIASAVDEVEVIDAQY